MSRLYFSFANSKSLVIRYITEIVEIKHITNMKIDFVYINHAQADRIDCFGLFLFSVKVSVLIAQMRKVNIHC